MKKVVNKVESYYTKDWDDTDLYDVGCGVTQIVELKVTCFAVLTCNLLVSDRNIENCSISFDFWAINICPRFACEFNHIILRRISFLYDRTIWYCKQSEDKQHVVLRMQRSH